MVLARKKKGNHTSKVCEGWETITIGFNLMLHLVSKCQTSRHRRHCNAMTNNKICWSRVAVKLVMMAWQIKIIKHDVRISSGYTGVWQLLWLQQRRIMTSVSHDVSFSWRHDGALKRRATVRWTLAQNASPCVSFAMDSWKAVLYGAIGMTLCRASCILLSFDACCTFTMH